MPLKLFGIKNSVASPLLTAATIALNPVPEPFVVPKVTMSPTACPEFVPDLASTVNTLPPAAVTPLTELTNT